MSIFANVQKDPLKKLSSNHEKMGEQIQNVLKNFYHNGDKKKTIEEFKNDMTQENKGEIENRIEQQLKVTEDFKESTVYHRSQFISMTQLFVENLELQQKILQDVKEKTNKSMKQLRDVEIKLKGQNKKYAELITQATSNVNEQAARVEGLTKELTKTYSNITSNVNSSNNSGLVNTATQYNLPRSGGTKKKRGRKQKAGAMTDELISFLTKLSVPLILLGTKNVVVPKIKKLNIPTIEEIKNKMRRENDRTKRVIYRDLLEKNTTNTTKSTKSNAKKTTEKKTTTKKPATKKTKPKTAKKTTATNKKGGFIRGESILPQSDYKKNTSKTGGFIRGKSVFPQTDYKNNSE